MIFLRKIECKHHLTKHKFQIQTLHCYTSPIYPSTSWGSNKGHRQQIIGVWGMQDLALFNGTRIQASEGTREGGLRLGLLTGYSIKYIFQSDTKSSSKMQEITALVFKRSKLKNPNNSLDLWSDRGSQHLANPPCLQSKIGRN